MDQDDHDIPFEPPTAKTRYAMMLPGTDEQPFPRTLHLSGRCAKNGSITLVHLAKGAPDIDVYSGKGTPHRRGDRDGAVCADRFVRRGLQGV